MSSWDLLCGQDKRGGASIRISERESSMRSCLQPDTLILLAMKFVDYGTWVMRRLLGEGDRERKLLQREACWMQYLRGY